MSVLIELTGGSTFVVDLFIKECPLASTNFLKLCKLKYYNNNLVFNLSRSFMLQTGDPTGTGKGGNSVQGLIKSQTLGKPTEVPLQDEVLPTLELNKAGRVCMVSGGRPNSSLSQFFVTLRGHDLEYLNGKQTIFGQVVEGLDALQALANDAFVDDDFRPYQDIRILHTFVLDDPFPDPPVVPDGSPTSARPAEEKVEARVPYGEDVDKDKEGKTAEQLEKEREQEKAKSNAEVLEIMGDLPSADVKPPENVLFVCQLNAITQDEDLELIFSRFGEIVECEIIRDKDTGESLNYAFIEFRTEEQCQEAYFKMNNVIIDDRRIKVDFSQSVAKIWNKYSMTARKPKTNVAPSTAKIAQKNTSQRPSSSRDAVREQERPYKGDDSRVRGRDDKPDRRDRAYRDRDRDYERDRRRRSRSRSRSRDRPRHKHSHTHKHRHEYRRRSRSRSRSRGRSGRR